MSTNATVSRTAERWLIRPRVIRVEERGSKAGYTALALHTERGVVEAQLYDAPGATSAVAMVGGAGGGFDTPALGLYPRLGEELPREGIAALRVRYRHPTEVPESTHDLLAGMHLLAERGIERIALVGHSLGGAVVIVVGAASPEVTTVVTLATQSYATDPVADLSPRPLLLIHGTEDWVLPARISERVFQRARKPKELRLFEEAGHMLDEVAEDVHQLVRGWVIENLRTPVSTHTKHAHTKVHARH